jgi:BirA family biotin operon repressor/biotin-[acetyl-CoA-carboxylase] ligase
MSLKINILKLLEQSRDKYISGEDMAFNFNVSRAAVNKAVNSLREEGHLIESVTKKGYRLLSESDVLSVEGILPYLRDDYRGNIYVFDTVESTNKTAKEIAMEGNEDGSVIVANGQTKGRGRQNRSFYSPKDTGVYMSYILRPQDDANIYNVVTVAACIAVCRAIYKLTGIECGIKWVNDIFLNGKKICGILTEGSFDLENGRINLVIIGIGINVSTKDFPEDLEAVAGSICNSKDGFVPRNRLVAEVLNELQSLTAPESLKEKKFIQEYREMSIVVGRDVEILVGENRKKAHVIDIDDNGGLVVRCEDGKVESLNYGEISLRWNS